MRYTIPALTLCIGGAQRMIVELANGLVSRGHSVSVLMPSTGVIEYPLRAKVIRTMDKYQLHPEDYPPGDVILSNFYLVVPSAEAASKQGKGLHVRISFCYEPAFLPNVQVTFPMYHLTKNLIVLSRWQQELIRLNHGIVGHIVPVGVSQGFKNLNLRKHNKQPLITAILRKLEGGFAWHREQDYLIQHLGFIQAKYPQVVIRFICPPGEFASSPTLQKLAAQKKYQFVSPANDTQMNMHYSQTDIFVSSSTYDSASLPGLEAMRCGTAVVSTYAGGNMDYLRHEENCLWSYRYENRLASDIERLLLDQNLRNKLSQNGEKTSLKWTWQRSVSRLEAAIAIIQSSQ